MNEVGQPPALDAPTASGKHKPDIARCAPGMECVSCGDTRPANTSCTRCDGWGLIHPWDPTDCPDCGYSGVQHPPTCLGCGRFRKWLDAAIEAGASTPDGGRQPGDDA